MNRKMIDQISTMCLCTNLKSKNNLLKEGVENKRIAIVGNPIVDTLLWATKKIKNKKNLNPNIMMTLHRSETVDNLDLFKKILITLDKCLKELEINLDYFCHPRSLKNLEKIKIKLTNIKIKKPLGYLDTIQKLKNTRFLITDSGGLQQEAYILGIKILTIMNSTPWPETLINGQNTLIKPNMVKKENLNKIICYKLENKKKIIQNYNIFGKPGKVSKNIYNMVVK
jgi:UDP-N-acetylglucosamine 2-epimerase